MLRGPSNGLWKLLRKLGLGAQTLRHPFPAHLGTLAPSWSHWEDVWGTSRRSGQWSGFSLGKPGFAFSSLEMPPAPNTQDPETRETREVAGEASPGHQGMATNGNEAALRSVGCHLGGSARPSFCCGSHCLHGSRRGWGCGVGAAGALSRAWAWKAGLGRPRINNQLAEDSFPLTLPPTSRACLCVCFCLSAVCEGSFLGRPVLGGGGHPLPT